MSTTAIAPDPITTIPTYISRRRLIEITGLSDTTIWRCVRRGDIPAPVRLSSAADGAMATRSTSWNSRTTRAARHDAGGFLRMAVAVLLSATTTGEGGNARASATRRNDPKEAGLGGLNPYTLSHAATG